MSTFRQNAEEVLPKFETPDLYKAAFFHTAGCLIEAVKQVEGASPPRSLWVFNDRATCMALDLAWTNRTAKVEPRSFSDSVRLLKSMVHQQTYKTHR